MLSWYVEKKIDSAFALAERLVTAVERIAEAVEAVQGDVDALARTVTEVESESGRHTYKAIATCKID